MGAGGIQDVKTIFASVYDDDTDHDTDDDVDDDTGDDTDDETHDGGRGNLYPIKDQGSRTLSRHE